MFSTIVILTVIGFVMVFAEIYVPGAVLGSLGGLCLIASIVLSYQEYGFAVGNFMLLGIALLTIASVIGGLYLFPHTPVGKRMMLGRQIESSEDHPDHSDLLGHEGVAMTSLRPSGKAMIDGRRIDVVSQGVMIDRDAAVEVILTEGAKVVVRAKI